MPEPEQKAFQKRQVAYKIRVSDILNKNLEKEDLSGNIRLSNTNVSRVNIIATVIYNSEEFNYSSAVVDDGTGNIQLRSFENNSYFSKAAVGDAVLVIGKIREFNGEKYILPEIFKKMNNVQWVDVRRLELKGSGVIGDNTISIDKNPAGDIKNDDLFSLIKKLDNGDGSSFDEIIKGYGSADAEKMLNTLLENGDIFEIKPGRLKVLE
ncbi:hypothetical protein J4234_05365 [Candidatus Woesearchaeota archaeon]|nr:hypothetical protein [Candidatus Woesearchaeota archaeon]